MKKIFAIALVALSTSALFAQDGGVLKANAGTLKAIETGKTSGVFEFTLPESVTAEQVANAAKYYTQYFTVNFDAKSHQAKIKMEYNQADSRFVIMRFLVSNNIKEIVMDGTTYNLEVFFSKFMN